ncbi:MAG: single-stranded DNA-binding protein [Microbacterium sp.]
MSNQADWWAAGNVAGDPELQYVGEQQRPRAVMQVAVDTGHRGEAGEWVKTGVIYHRIVCWRNLAERVAHDVRRGDAVVVAGEMKFRSWVDATGKHCQGWEIHASHVAPDPARMKVTVDRTPRAASVEAAGDVPAAAPGPERGFATGWDAAR